MKYPKKLLSLRNLQGGQFGTVDVTAISDQLIELDFGPDFVRLSPAAAAGLIAVLQQWLDQPPVTLVAEPPPPIAAREVMIIIEG